MPTDRSSAGTTSKETAHLGTAADTATTALMAGSRPQGMHVLPSATCLYCTGLVCSSAPLLPSRDVDEEYEPASEAPEDDDDLHFYMQQLVLEHGLKQEHSEATKHHEPEASSLSSEELADRPICQSYAAWSTCAQGTSCRHVHGLFCEVGAGEAPCTWHSPMFGRYNGLCTTAASCKCCPVEAPNLFSRCTPCFFALNRAHA